MSSEQREDKIFVSVIIPVLNDALGLRNCLQALFNQTVSRDLYEVLVVDNGAIESRLIKDVVSSFSGTVYLQEPRVSSYAARNRGISTARGNVFVFVDADCVPAKDFIESGCKYFQHSDGYLMLAGRIDVFCVDRDRPTAVELHEIVFAFPQKFYIEKMHFAVTANMWTSRKVFDKVGIFSGDLLSGGDRYFGEQAFSQGIRQTFAGDVIVRHAARHSFRDLARMYVRIVGGDRDRRLIRRQSKLLFMVDILFDGGIFLRQSVCSWRTYRLKSFRERIVVVGIALCVLFVRVKERFRLFFGGVSVQ